MFSRDFKELLSAFSEHHVKYLIVGGYALAVHAQPRATKDLDIFIRPDGENAKAVFTALTKFGAPLEGVQPEDLVARGSFFRMGTAPQMVEIFSEISGVEFEDAWDRRVEETVDEATGLRHSSSQRRTSSPTNSQPAGRRTSQMRKPCSARHGYVRRANEGSRIFTGEAATCDRLYAVTSMPMERAVPLMLFTAASTEAALRSGIFCFAISRT